MLVVVPALNEEQSIGAVLAELRALTLPFDVVVIDDGCTDRTAEIAAEAGATVLSLPFNVGVGGAMRLGMIYAHRHGYDGVVQVDADGQHDPGQIGSLLKALDRVDVAIGCRFGDGGYRVRGPRWWAMRLLAWSLSRICGTRLTDVTSGFRATGPGAIPLLARYYPREYLGDTVESLVIVAKAGLSVGEVGVTMRRRAGGRPSQSPLRATLYVARAALVLLLAVIRPHPTVPTLTECAE